MFSIQQYNSPSFSEKRFSAASDCVFTPVESDGVAPEGFHALTIYPEYFKYRGRWLLAEDSRMDCAAVLEDERICVRELRRLKKGDLTATGRAEDASEGIYVDYGAFADDKPETGGFVFRSSRSRETAFSGDYNELCELLRYERVHGKVAFVLGPACVFDYGAREAMSALIRGGYVHALLAGNALATHDLEAAYLGTALGQDIRTRQNRTNGHYNHLETINEVRRAGSISRFIQKNGLKDGVICACEEKNVPFVLVGSVRDDGPLPEVYGNVYDGQDAMRALLREATTVIAVATTLHSIAAGNMTPCYRVKDNTVRPVYFYSVDVSEFAANKLTDRGSVTAKSFVTNAQDFLFVLCNGLGL